MNPPDDFVALILTHGRPDNIRTLHTLQRAGYTGPWFLVIDDEDPTAGDYYRIHGQDRVIQFSKDEIAATFDQGDNFNDRRCISYARNAAYRIARDLGYRYFIQLDDDYINFRWMFDGELRFARPRILDLDAVLTAMLDYYKTTPQVVTIAMAQGGDLIGGEHSPLAVKVYLKRKAMNSFICDTERQFTFPGRLNEDVNAYTAVARTGPVFFTTSHVFLDQVATQAGAGGMSDIYAAQGTYVKSFYTVMHTPSAAKVYYTRGTTHYRLHHRVNYNACAPKILHPRHRKAATTT